MHFIPQFIDKICAHHDVDRATVAEAFEGAVSAVPPELGQDAIDDAVSEVVQRWFPWEPLPVGSVGRLLQDGGDWLLGLRGEADGVVLEIVGASLTAREIQPSSTWLTPSVTFAVERDGERTTYDVVPPGDHSGNVRDGLELRASQDSLPRVVALLSELAAELAQAGDWDHVGSLFSWPLELLAAAQQAPSDRSLFTWCRSELLPRLVPEPLRVQRDGRSIRVKVQGRWLPDDTLTARKQGWIDVMVMLHDEDDAMVDAEETSFSVGHLTAASLTAPWPDEALKERAMQWADLWRRRLEHDLGCAIGASRFQALPDTRPDLLKLIAFSSEHGPPPDPPVPPFDDAAFHRGAELLRDPSSDDLAQVEAYLGQATAAPMAVLRLGSSLLVFGADQSRPPHDVSDIWLRSDEEPDEWVQVLLTDVWSPSTRWSIDGDPLAFRRFIQWLRGVLSAAGIDERYDFPPDEQLTLADWLAFGRPGDDSDLLDWRCEDYIIAAGHPLQGAAGKEAAHTRIWRRFLEGVVLQ